MSIRISENIEDYYILDVRDEEEYERKSIPGSHNIPHRMILVVESPGSIGFYVSKIPKDKIILLYCSTGNRASQVERILVYRGHEVMNILTYEHAEDYVKSLKVISK